MNYNNAAFEYVCFLQAKLLRAGILKEGRSVNERRKLQRLDDLPTPAQMSNLATALEDAPMVLFVEWVYGVFYISNLISDEEYV